VKRSTLLWITLLTLVAATLVRLEMAGVTGLRGVKLLDDPSAGGAAPFDLAQSAALFVGVQEFDDRTIAKVPYAGDDAIDLAHAFAMNANVRLVRPDRVVLALSGKPRKAASRKRLEELRAAGAVITGAGREEIMRRLRHQAAAAGSRGLLILSFATHGFSSEGTPYVLASTSRLGDPATSLPATSLFDTAARSGARRSLIFVDACRDRITAGARTGQEAMTAAPVIEAMLPIAGQVVFYAAAPGQYAYDDPVRRNGVFTAAVLDGLQCKAEHDATGLMTVSALQTYVETYVREWVQKHHDKSARGVIQVVMDGETKTMPVAVCSTPTMQSLFTIPVVNPPERVKIEGQVIATYSETGMPLWRSELPRPVRYAEAADLDGDGRKEIVADDGELVVFSAAGDRLWSGGAIRKFVVLPHFRDRNAQVVAISDGTPSRLSIFNAKGQLVAAYSHPGPLLDVKVDARTARHAPKIIVTGTNDQLRSILHVSGPVGSAFMLDPKKVRGSAPPYLLGAGTQLWYGTILPAHQTIDGLTVIDYDNDGQRDISLHTSAGQTLHVDFDGQLIGRQPGVHFELIAK
jgi:uncharacterized caspase-like protein